MASESDSDAGSESAAETPFDGALADTYVAAIQHDLRELPAGATRVGVVRKPTSWFHGAVDENVSALGPPADLLESFRQTEEDLKMRGVCDEGAHNAAWDEVDFEARYRTHLEEDEDARAALEAFESRLTDGETLALVCYENTEKKRCHRTVLRDALEDRAAGK